MDTVVLGRTGLEVGVAGLGCGGRSRLGQNRGNTLEESVAVVRAALDLGVNYIDTARIYGTEPIVGKALIGRRDEAVISTKVPIRSRETKMLADVATVRSHVEESLRNLQTDTIDVLHLHGVLPEDYEYAVGELLPELVRFRDAGSVRFLGISETFINDPTHTMLDRATGGDLFDVVLVGFNSFNTSARKWGLPGAIAHDVGVTVMCAVHELLARPDALREEILALIAEGVVGADEIDPNHPLQFLTEDGAARSIIEASYRFARHEPGCHVILTGTGDVDHLRQNAASINLGPLPEVTLGRLRALFGTLALSPTVTR